MSAQGNDVVVLSAGAVTPIGLSLAETAASARARLANLREIDWCDRRFNPFVVGSVPDDGLPELETSLRLQPRNLRGERMLRMAHVALAEALTGLPELPGPLPLLLGLPEHHAREPLEPRTFMKYLQAQTGLRFHKSSVAVPAGRAAGLQAIGQATTRLQDGAADFVLIGGVDSLLDLYVLGSLDLEGRIRNASNPDGFAPAEGAAFLLLTTLGKAREIGVQPLARVAAHAIAHEAGHLYSDEPYAGEGLAAAFSSMLQDWSGAPMASVFASFNGERYWGKEFAVARLRNSAHFAEPLQMEHPAESFGDLGAAHGVVMAAMAAHAVAGAYRHAPSLVYASSDHGARAAAVLTALA